MTFHSFDGDYIRRLTDGDPEVEAHFAGYFGDLLYLKLRARLRSRQLVEDVRQETLLRVLQTLRRKGGVDHPERFGAFVNAVCNNVMMEMSRAEWRQDQMGEHDTDTQDTSIDLDAPLISSERKQKVQQVLAEMPEKDRNLLRTIFLEERDKREVCERYHVDGDYLRVLLHRAKSRFRKIYLQQGNSPR